MSRTAGDITWERPRFLFQRVLMAGAGYMLGRQCCVSRKGNDGEPEFFKDWQGIVIP